MHFEDKPILKLNGFLAFFILIGVIGWAVYTLLHSQLTTNVPWPLLLTIVAATFCLKGLFLLKPRQGAVFLFFGKYAAWPTRKASTGRILST